MPKAFLLDPAKNVIPLDHQMPKFLRLAAERGGWDVARSQTLEPSINARQWVSDLEKGLQDANIIVGLGNFGALRSSGDQLKALLTIIRQKIKSGCPALLQTCEPVSFSPFAQSDRHIRNFFDSLGVHITANRVASSIREFELDPSLMYCILRKADDSLLDPILFDGVNEVAASSLRLIDYDFELFPVIEASRLHFFVTEGDEPTHGNLGRKNAVAVRTSGNRECLIVLAGFFLNDSVEIDGRRVSPGFEDNEVFANNLIDLLTFQARSKSDHIIAYELFRELELRLGRMIQDTLTVGTVNGDFSDLIPEQIRSKLVAPDGKLDYSRATYIHLVAILKALWPKFERHFSDPAGRHLTRDEVIKPLFEINGAQRVYLAHPHKAEQHNIKFGLQDVAAIRQALDLVRRASVASAMPN
jgi:hypothetical protein